MAEPRRLLISGVVQGVGFRWSARREAERLGVRGWVRNRRDGRVEALVAGDPDAVAGFVAWCRQGPPSARVDDVAEAPAPGEDPGRGFETAPTV